MKKKSRLKTWEVNFSCHHESFNGYELNDGIQTYTVEALTYKSAVNKAKKMAKKYFFGESDLSSVLIKN